MLATALAAGMITTNAAIDDNGAHVPGPEVTCVTNRYYFYMSDSWYNEQLDVDGDGDVTVRDATEIQKYIVELECPEIIGTGVHLDDDGWYGKVD